MKRRQDNGRKGKWRLGKALRSAESAKVRRAGFKTRIDRKYAKVRAKGGRTYISRFYALAILGYSSYGQYLKSPLWKRVRALVFRVKGHVCCVPGCPNRAVQVHHRRYTVADLLGEVLDYLWPICRQHHGQIEFDGEEGAEKGRRKVHLSEANRRLDRLIEESRQKVGN